MPRRPPIDTGVIYCDDNLARLARLPAETVDLIYLDPPFFSNQNYEVIWGDESEVRSFEDRWRGGIHVYIEWMRHRLIELHRVLKDSGSLYLHCDPNAAHYLKVMLDDVFGPSMFRSEVIWKRSSAHNSARRYGPVHDTIFFYTKTDTYYWKPVYQPLPRETIDAWYNNVESGTGRRYNRADLTAAGKRAGPSGASWRGIDVTAKGRHWAIPRFVKEIVGELPTIDALDALDAAGRIHWPQRADGMPMLKRYVDESKGVPAQDMITHISPLKNNSRPERLGYPTQKPESLLELFIEASSRPGDVVLDPFCGCGTTIAVAHRLRREWIGIDISLTAAKLMLWRMSKLGVRALVEGLPKTDADLKRLKPFEFQNWVISRFNGKHAPRKSGDFGVDGYSFLEHLPIQVKQSEKVGRVPIDNFQTAVKRERKHKGYFVAFSFTRNAYEEVARAKRQENIEIVLVPVSTLLEDQTTIPAAATEQLFHDLLPQPAVPGHAELPSVEELFASAARA